MAGISFLVSIILLIIWKIGNKRDWIKAEKMANDFYRGTNTLRQQELFSLFCTGKGVDGKPLTAPHKCYKEVQRLVKIQIEKEGYRYANDNFWNLDHAVFDSEGNLVSLGGRRVDPATGQVVP